MKKMTRFDFANKASAKLKALTKLPAQKKALNRAFESSIDALTDANLDLEDDLERTRTELYTSDRASDKQPLMERLVDIKIQIADNNSAIVILTDEKEVMYTEIEVEEVEE